MFIKLKDNEIVSGFIQTQQYIKDIISILCLLDRTSSY